MSSFVSDLSDGFESLSSTVHTVLHPMHNNEKDITPKPQRAVRQVFGHKLAHTRIRAALGNQITTSSTYPHLPSRRPKRLAVDSGDTDYAPREEGRVSQLDYSSSDDGASWSDEERERKRFSRPSPPEHNYAALGINPDLPLHHPLNQQLHASSHPHLSPSGFHPLASPPVGGGALAPAGTPFVVGQRPVRPTQRPLMHPGLLGIRRDTDTSRSFMGTSKQMTAGTFSSSPFISPQLHAQLEFHMANRPSPLAGPGEYATSPSTPVEPVSPPAPVDPKEDQQKEKRKTKSKKGKAKPEPESKSEADFQSEPNASSVDDVPDSDSAVAADKSSPAPESAAKSATPMASDKSAAQEAADAAVMKLLSRQSRRRPRPPAPRVTGTHQLNFAHDAAIHSVREPHAAHYQEHAHQLIAPVITAGWQERDALDAREELYSRFHVDSNGTLVTSDGARIDPSSLDLNDALLDPETRQFLVAYVQSHTSKKTLSESDAVEWALAEREREIERQARDAELRASQLSKVTDADRQREREREMALKEAAQTMPQLYTDLPDLPELPESFYDLEATFHQQVTARKTDIASSVGALMTLREAKGEDELEHAELTFLRSNRRKWRRRSFTHGDGVEYIPGGVGFKQIPGTHPDPVDGDVEEEWRPLEITDQFIPDSKLGGGLRAVLHEVNAASASAAGAAALPSLPDLPRPSKPLAVLRPTEQDALERADQATIMHAAHGLLEEEPQPRIGAHRKKRAAEPKSKVISLASRRKPKEKPAEVTVEPALASPAPSDSSSLPSLPAAPSSSLDDASVESSDLPPEVPSLPSSAESTPRGQPSLPNRSSDSDGEEAESEESSNESEEDEDEDDDDEESEFDSLGRLKLTDPNLPEEERNRRLHEFMSQRERELDETAAAAAAALAASNRSSRSMRNSVRSLTDTLVPPPPAPVPTELLVDKPAFAAAVEHHTKLEKTAEMLSREHDAIRREEEERKRQERIYQMEIDIWEKKCVELQENYVKSESDRVSTLAAGRVALESALASDGEAMTFEESQLAETKGRLDQLQEEHDRMTHDINDINAAIDVGRAQWDTQLLDLEGRVKSQHSFVLSLQNRLETNRTTNPSAPEDTVGVEALRQGEQYSEELLQQYESLFEQKEDWLQAKNEEIRQLEETLAPITRDLDLARSTHTALLTKVTHERDDRQSALTQLEEFVEKYSQPIEEPFMPSKPIKPLPKLAPTIDTRRERTPPLPNTDTPTKPTTPTPTQAQNVDNDRIAAAPVAIATPVAVVRPAEPSPLPPRPRTPEFIPPPQPAMPEPVPAPVPTPLPPAPVATNPQPAHPTATPTYTKPANVSPEARQQPPMPTPLPPTPLPEPARTPPTNNQPSATAAPATTPSSPATAVVAPPASSSPLDAAFLISYFSRGFDFRLHSLSSSGGVTRASAKLVYLWSECGSLDPSTGSVNLATLIPMSNFFCCDAEKSRRPISSEVQPDTNGRYRTKEQKLPFSIIETILPGKLTPVLKHPLNEAIDESKCFAFGGPRAMVSLEAASGEIKEEWINHLKILLKQAKMAANAATSAGVTPASPSTPSRSTVVSTTPTRDAKTPQPQPPAAAPSPPKQPAQPMTPIQPPIPTPAPATSSPSPAPSSTLVSSLPPLLEVAQRYKPAKSLTDSLSLLAYGSVFRLFSCTHHSPSGARTLVDIGDYLFYVDFSLRSESRLGSRGNSVAATPRTKNATSPVLQASLYWCTPGKRQKVKGQVHYLTDVLSVTEGKHGSDALFQQATRALTNPNARIIPASHCFTLVVATSTSTPPSTLHLTIQTPSLQLRTLFLRGIYEIFERQFDKLHADAVFDGSTPPERVDIQQQREPEDDHLIVQPVQPMSPRSPRAMSPPPSSRRAPPDEQKYTSSSAVSASSPRSPRANDELLALLLDVLSRGEEFTQYFHTHPSPTSADLPLKRRIFLWVEFPDMTPAESEEGDDVIHSQSGAVVHWCDAVAARGGPQATDDDKGVHRFMEAGHSFSLASINQVVAGKRTPALLHPSNARVPESCCLTFTSTESPPPTAVAPMPRPFALDLECDQESVQQLWMGGLKHVLAQHQA